MFVRKIARIIGAEGNIQEEILEYGLKQMLLSLLNFVTTMVLGIVFGCVYEGCIFILAYAILRSFAGGYHAKTPLRCYFASVFLISIFFALMKVMNNRTGLLLTAVAVSIVMVFALAPIEAVNKPLDKEERLVYRRRTRQILFIEVCLIIAGYILKSDAWKNEVSMAVQMTALLLFISWVQKKSCPKRRGGVSNGE